MKKNGAFVNLFLSEEAQKSPKNRRHPKKIGMELLCFSELEATSKTKPELHHANLKVIYICGRQRHQNRLIG
jgi:hypothetical protein